MGAYLLRRLALTIPVLLGAATLVFALIHLVPGDPAQAMLGATASQRDAGRLRPPLGLYQPLPVQFRAFVTGLARGNLGPSFRFGTPVGTEIRRRLPQTALLALCAMLCAVAIGIRLGFVAAVFRGRL